MKPWQPASKEFVRIFYAHNQHIAVVTGRKPRHCPEVDLVRISARATIPTFSIVRRAEKSTVTSAGLATDRYYLVKPLLPGPAHSHIRVRHVGGTERIPVEPLGSKVDSSAPRRLPAALSEGSSALGYSQNFSMDEAFNDALAHLPAMGHDHLHRTLTLVDVVSMGAIYGGFSGFSRLFVKVEQSSAAMPSGTGEKRSIRKPLRN